MTPTYVLIGVLVESIRYTHHDDCFRIDGPILLGDDGTGGSNFEVAVVWGLIDLNV